MNRREFLSTAAGTGVLASCGRGVPPEKAESRPPNIIFIMLDDLGYADFGCYGGQMIETPVADQLYKDGLSFTDCYAGGAVCAPSRCVLMTGMHTGHGSIRANALTAPILPEDVTVGEVLKEAGYVTGVFGKWGLGDAHTTGVPNRQGFDESFGYLHQIHAHNYYPNFLWHNGEKYLLPGNADRKKGQYSADVIFEKSLDFIRVNKERPFFYYGAWTLPHGRYEIPSDAPYTDKDWPQAAKNYVAMVTKADTQIGRLRALLGELKLEQDTVLFVTSDNGGTRESSKFFDSNRPLRGYKGQVYEGGIRVPMLVYWAGKTDAGRVSRVPWYFADFLPTAAELAGAKAPAGIDGKSVVATIIGNEQPVHDFLYWEQNGFNRKTGRLRPESLQQGVRMADWKAVIPKPGAPLELYNLAEDIGESKDLSTERPDIVTHFTDYLAGARSEPRPQVGGRAKFATE